MRLFPRRCVIVAGVLAAATAVLAADKPSIEGLELRRVDDEILVSFKLAGVFDDETLERLDSGIELTFEHKITLQGKRVFPLLPRKALGRTLVVMSVRYDSLTRRYEMLRTVVGKDWPSDRAAPDRIERRSASSREEMEDWMTSLADIALPYPDREPDFRLRVRVHTDLGLRFVLLFFPWPQSVNAEAWVQP